MTRKGKQTVEHELRRRGARVVQWEHGQKHEIAIIALASGTELQISFSRGMRDEVRFKRFIENRIKEAERSPKGHPDMARTPQVTKDPQCRHLPIYVVYAPGFTATCANCGSVGTDVRSAEDARNDLMKEIADPVLYP